MNCQICNQPFSFCWTDAHGVAQCRSCGVPYRIYHYEDNKRVEKPPKICVVDAWLPVVQAYWNEKKRILPSGCSFPGSDQELATQDDMKAWDKWCDANKDKYYRKDLVVPKE